MKTKLEQVQLRLTSVQDELTEKNHEIQSRHRIEQQDIREVEQLRKVKVDLELRLKDMKDGMRQAEEEVRSEQERINAKAKKEKSLFERRISELEVNIQKSISYLATNYLGGAGGSEGNRLSFQSLHFVVKTEV